MALENKLKKQRYQQKGHGRHLLAALTYLPKIESTWAREKLQDYALSLVERMQ